mgnify:FL=1
MGVPGGRAIFLQPGRPSWQPLDSPLWQATPRDDPREAAWEDFGPSNPLLGSDGFTRSRTPGALSSRPRSAGSTMASLEAAKAAGEAARAAADAALAAAQLIVQDTSGPVESAASGSGTRPSAMSEVTIAVPCPSAEQGSERSRGRSVEVRPALMLQDFLRSLNESQDLSALDRRMELAQSKPPVGVEVPGRWQQGSAGEGPRATPPMVEAPAVETLSSLEDFVRGLVSATRDFDVAVGASPAPSPPRASFPSVKPCSKERSEPEVVVPSPMARGSRSHSKPRRQVVAPTTGNLATMAAYVAEKEIHVSSVTAASTRSSTVATGGWNEVKLPPLPQKTREALEAAAMQPLYVKEAFKLLEKPSRWAKPVSKEPLRKVQALPAIRSSSMPSLVARPASDRGKRDTSNKAPRSVLGVRHLRSSRSTGSLC